MENGSVEVAHKQQVTATTYHKTGSRETITDKSREFALGREFHKAFGNSLNAESVMLQQRIFIVYLNHLSEFLKLTRIRYLITV